MALDDTFGNVWIDTRSGLAVVGCFAVLALDEPLCSFRIGMRLGLAVIGCFGVGAMLSTAADTS
eukprot:6188591-Pleurochrysis_carterae.AAC.2